MFMWPFGTLWLSSVFKWDSEGPSIPTQNTLPKISTTAVGMQAVWGSGCKREQGPLRRVSVA